MTSLRDHVPAPWRSYLDGCVALERVERFLAAEHQAGRGVQPGSDRVFRALEMTAPDEVRAVITAQDPYPGVGIPTGLAFSVPDGAALPQSLRNVFREYSEDLGLPYPTSGDLSPWARGGVLLLNAALTCEPGRPGSHARSGWHEVTRHLLTALTRRRRGIAFLCWGRSAVQLIAPLELEHHAVIESAHPSPLSARRGWFGSRPFTRCNAALVEMGARPVPWPLT